jgi:hypothetical protein
MERLRRRDCCEVEMEGGRARVRKCVRRVGIRVVRTSNQCAERRVRSAPLEGMP